ncbi:MAG: hypothetical protein DRJ67_12480 [Thermoprotei archaeon]|nr:MAG: hypothetical protein DRJ67_12480 [Thermoprotei archaeon]
MCAIVHVRVARVAVRVGDYCPRCGRLITSLSVKRRGRRSYLYAYHGSSCCYLGPVEADHREILAALNRLREAVELLEELIS